MYYECKYECIGVHTHTHTYIHTCIHIYNQASILSTMDVTMDGFGYMLAFGVHTHTYIHTCINITGLDPIHNGRDYGWIWLHVGVW